MKKYFLLPLMILTLFGCVSSGTSKISNINSVERKIKSEQDLNKTKIKAMYGEPNSIFRKDGKEVYEYKYITVQNSILGYVPILGMWFDRTYKSNYLYAYFNADGSLSDYATVGVKGNYPRSLKKEK